MEIQPKRPERLAQIGTSTESSSFQSYDPAEYLQQQREQARRAEAERADAERRTRTGLFAAALMAETMISMATNSEPNPRVRHQRRQQLHAIWRGFSAQLIGRASRRGAFGI